MVVGIYADLRRMQKLLERFYIEKNPNGVSIPILLLLEGLLTSGPQSQSQLTVRALIDRSSASEVLRRMYDAGLVARVRNEDRKNAYVISITPAGRKKLTEARAAMEHAQQRFLRLMPTALRPTFIDAALAVGAAYHEERK